MTKFNTGDTAYLAQAKQTQVWITCPECLGSGRLRVILGDDSEVSIACECCSRGYEGSLGKMSTYEFRADSRPIQITGVEANQRGDKLIVRYSSGYWSIEEENLFATREEALSRAHSLVIKHQAEAKRMLGLKEKQHKTWAWNVRYWRSGIRKAKEEIARYEAHLNVAPKNVKEADKQETI